MLEVFLFLCACLRVSGDDNADDDASDDDDDNNNDNEDVDESNDKDNDGDTSLLTMVLVCSSPPRWSPSLRAT